MNATPPLVYLDNNATTSVAPEVVAAMEPYFTTHWGNPSSMHAFGGRVMRDVEASRARVAALIHADPSEIVFTSCGTESDNCAIYGAAEILGAQSAIVTSRVEHPAVLGPCRHFRDDHAYHVVEIGVDGRGQLDLDALRHEVQAGPAMVTLMWANNETGVIFPMDEIARIVKGAGGVLHSDAVQAVGKVPVDVRRTPVDLLSFSGHKLHAPKGIGVLYVRRGTRLKTFMIGGHQEGGRRGGTENVPYIMGLARACDLAAEHLRDAPRIARLRDRLEQGLLKSCPDASVNGDPQQRVPNTSNMSFSFIEGEAILYHLSDLGICASSGSACSSGSLEPSHVIRAMGIPFTAAHGSIRFSLSRYTTERDIDYVLEHMPRIVAKLRTMSPFVT
ncbi:MAG: cysteine desulfurase NifS [Kiritimatiellae bacterium]|nr:cysteine desulfurase NifS [Kiritimatiellia bacterium]